MQGEYHFAIVAVFYIVTHDAPSPKGYLKPQKLG
jgi:hypothetical protein